MKPLPIRILVTALVALAILIPVELIKGKVHERRARAEAVANTFAAETSGPQVIVGPFLALTCEETVHEEKSTRTCAPGYFTPHAFEATAALPVETRARGIYPIRVFTADARFTGAFDWPAQRPAEGTSTYAWKDAYLVWHVRDPRGIKAFTSARNASLAARSGDFGIEGFTLREHIGRYAPENAGKPLEFSHAATIVGTGSFEVAPIGDRNKVAITSNWRHPAFGRTWSPDKRDISADGFEATWRIDSLATGGSATWKRLAIELKLATATGAGVSLFEPVNVYSLSYRATEYAFLFVLFTFTALALTEALGRAQLHPVQYGLTGLAVAIFFLLLLALSEHIRFDAAYAIAALACVALIGAYLRPVLRSRAAASLHVAIFGAMYATLYVLLRSEDHALLIGSVLVFGLLATVMLATRKISWPWPSRTPA